MTTITFSVDDDAVMATFARLQRAATDMTPAMDAIGNAMANLVRGRFSDGADPWGAPWAPLKPTTIARRRNGSSTPLRDTGKLRASVQYQAGADSVSINVGRDDSPAAVHQFGNPSNRFFGRAAAPIPARPFLPIRGGRVDLEGTEDQDVLLDVMEAHIAKAVSG